jgi:hypothetical protein
MAVPFVIPTASVNRTISEENSKLKGGGGRKEGRSIGNGRKSRMDADEESEGSPDQHRFRLHVPDPSPPSHSIQIIPFPLILVFQIEATFSFLEMSPDRSLIASTTSSPCDALLAPSTTPSREEVSLAADRGTGSPDELGCNQGTKLPSTHQNPVKCLMMSAPNPTPVSW